MFLSCSWNLLFMPMYDQWRIYCFVIFVLSCQTCPIYICIYWLTLLLFFVFTLFCFVYEIYYQILCICIEIIFLSCLTLPFLRNLIQMPIYVECKIYCIVVYILYLSYFFLSTKLTTNIFVCTMNFLFCCFGLVFPNMSSYSLHISFDFSCCSLSCLAHKTFYQYLIISNKQCCFVVFGNVLPNLSSQYLYIFV